nr:retrovirus-related Pol polyprotein from transposon TNT 1-94 [Tanacetum cinerariifolium]
KFIRDFPVHRSSSFDQFNVKSNREMMLLSWEMKLHKLFQLAYDVHTYRMMIPRLVIILEGDMCQSGLWYPKGSSYELTAFSDADHVGCIDSHKSTSGGVQFLGDKLVSWMSKKQNCTAMSSAEAEYLALSASCAQVMWMRTQLQDYGFNYNKILLYCDSQSAIVILCSPVQHSRTKHIHTRYHFKKEQVENELEVLAEESA